MIGDSRLVVMRQLLAKHQDDGLEHKRAVKVRYEKADGRQIIGWFEATKLRWQQKQKVKRRA